jgi:hypothetical protein
MIHRIVLDVFVEFQMRPRFCNAHSATWEEERVYASERLRVSGESGLWDLTGDCFAF